jgi:DNA mismatch repair protein MSH6
MSSRGRSSSRASNRTRSSRSRSSADDDFEELGNDFCEEDEEVGKAKGKAKSKKSATSKGAPAKSANDGAPAPGGMSFLTAAEQRAQGKKNEKQSSDEAFFFLKDPKDVGYLSRMISLVMAYGRSRKMKTDPGHLTTTRVPS